MRIQKGDKGRPPMRRGRRMIFTNHEPGCGVHIRCAVLHKCSTLAAMLFFTFFFFLFSFPSSRLFSENKFIQPPHTGVQVWSTWHIMPTSVRLMYLSVYDSRDSSFVSAPSPFPHSSLTHVTRVYWLSQPNLAYYAYLHA